MNNIDVELHEKIHKKMMEVDSNSIFKDRVDTFEYVESIIGKSISGIILDVGCGNGYASIWLAKNRKNISVTALESSEVAVSELIPKHVAYHNVEDIVSPKNGSFDCINEKEKYDFVFAFGALHHSSCLYKTMSSVYDSIVDGGFFIANEPVMPNYTTHQNYIDKYNIVQNLHGFQVRNGDRNDCFFREAEYIAAALYSGFNLISINVFNPKPRGFSSKVKFAFESHGVFGLLKRVICKVLGSSDDVIGLLKRMISKVLGSSDDENIFDTEQEKYRNSVKNVKTKIFIFQKKKVSYIPHLWEKLK
jgi:2-polyprenyl-3-methyl-5-hydroxy-6-metoxy-1,4-benzoquinol methylase